MKLYIKYMISARCKDAVRAELKKLGLHFIIIDQGVVEVMELLSEEQREHIRIALLNAGLELMDDKKAALVQGIKNIIVEIVHEPNEGVIPDLPKILTQKLNTEYAFLEELFSEIQGTTIEEYFGMHKAERIKELIVYDELSIAEIAQRMSYSSVAELSNQFKKITGLMPAHFKQLKDKRRK